jgi:hypothetical protein
LEVLGVQLELGSSHLKTFFARVFFHNSNFMRLFTLESLGHGLHNLAVPSFLDETIEKPMSHCLKAFVYSGNPIWAKRLEHVLSLLIKNILLKKSMEIWLP